MRSFLWIVSILLTISCFEDLGALASREKRIFTVKTTTQGTRIFTLTSTTFLTCFVNTAAMQPSGLCRRRRQKLLTALKLQDFGTSDVGEYIFPSFGEPAVNTPESDTSMPVVMNRVNLGRKFTFTTFTTVTSTFFTLNVATTLKVSLACFPRGIAVTACPP